MASTYKPAERLHVGDKIALKFRPETVKRVSVLSTGKISAVFESGARWEFPARQSVEVLVAAPRHEPQDGPGGKERRPPGPSPRKVNRRR